MMNRRRLFAYLFVLLAWSGGAARGDELVNEWKFRLRRPADGWQKAEFDDSGWRTGQGGFGTRGTPGARIGTRWRTRNIWLRKTVDLEQVPEKPGLLIHHDEDAEVYVNGQQVAELSGWSSKYEVVPLDAKARSALVAGKNVVAVHCRQTDGGQFIDVHLVDVDNVPELPKVTKPTPTSLMTVWGAAVTPENAWREYPRPQMQRDDWQCLNGNWDYAIGPDGQSERPSQWAGQILVPFCLESKLGGVQRLLAPEEWLWYHRTFTAQPKSGKRTLLHFEAVDYDCEVWVNGKSVGTHKGGNTAFTFDITDAVQDGENDLVVRVNDDTQAWQLHGKQVLDPNGIWYTRVSGIWQTVWLEETNATYLSDLTISSDVDTDEISVTASIAGDAADVALEIEVAGPGGAIVSKAQGDEPVATAKIPNAEHWTPDNPKLYEFEARLVDKAGNVVDRVQSYAAIRSVGTMRDEAGNVRLTLNGKPIFHWGPLDQGWWPDGLLTPPSDAGMLFDVEFLKEAGFNMIRKHIKVEPRRYYYHCDRLGMMVWQDQVNADHGAPWTHLAPNPRDAQWPDERHEQFMEEFEAMVDLLENHPSIVMWQPFNEAWGQHRSMATGEWIVKRDPSRLVNISSGGNFWPVGHVADQHAYPHPNFPIDNDRFRDYVKVVGEFGGHGFPVADHLWVDDGSNWGYGSLPKTIEELRGRYVESLNRLNELRKQGVSAGVYTQTTDVEGEINGLMTYDRKVQKIPAKELAELHKRLFKD
ncbi:MAG: glycoside hydrolase family 2 [Planctomycetaceae bacterium]|nr:glycoside hydrolase family 2 [Planctomycetaceae bacterium]